MPGVVKIGATNRDPRDRLAEANARHTWCPPEPYIAALTAPVADAFATERAIHTLLAVRRINPRLEFFRLTDDEMRALFAMLAPIDGAEAAPIPAPRVVAQPQTLELKMREWVESSYVHIEMARKDEGTKLKDLYEAYLTAVLNVHQRPLQKGKFGLMLRIMFPGIGPYTNRAGTVQGLFLLVRRA